MTLTLIFDGPHQYAGPGINAIHRPLVEKWGLKEEHFDIMAELLCETLVECGVDQAEIDTIGGRVNDWRDCVLCLNEWQ